jgi:DNA-binding transcriptional LysR family regulator
MHQTPDLNLLIALDALLAENSVAKAAKRLGLSGSAMSRTLTRLREATGDALLVRAGRTMAPTPRADELRDRARRVAEEARAVLAPKPAELDLANLERTFTIRVGDGLAEILAIRLIKVTATSAPNVCLRFAPKPDKDVGPHREGLIDLEIGVPPADAAPELRLQALFHDHFVGVARAGHPLLDRPITPESYAACSHVVVTRRGKARGLVDAGLAEFHLERKIMAVVTSFPAALAIAGGTDLVALVPSWFTAKMPDSLVRFDLPVPTTEITVSQLWHPRLDADPAHRWLRGLVQAACRDLSPAQVPGDSRPLR